MESLSEARQRGLNPAALTAAPKEDYNPGGGFSDLIQTVGEYAPEYLALLFDQYGKRQVHLSALEIRNATLKEVESRRKYQLALTSQRQVSAAMILSFVLAVICVVATAISGSPWGLGVVTAALSGGAGSAFSISLARKWIANQQNLTQTQDDR